MENVGESVMQTEGAIECAQSMMYLEAEDKWGVDEKKRVSSGAKADLQIPLRGLIGRSCLWWGARVGWVILCKPFTSRMA